MAAADEPEVLHELQRGDEADAHRRNACLGGNLLHLQADQL